MPCESSAANQTIDQSKFWDEDGIHWEPHRIGWAIAGGCTVIVRRSIVKFYTRVGPLILDNIRVDVYYFFGCHLEALSVR